MNYKNTVTFINLLNQSIEEKLFDPILFQYKPLNDNTKKIFIKDEIFFQSITKFNDSNEGKFQFDDAYNYYDIAIYADKLIKEGTLPFEGRESLINYIKNNKKTFDETCLKKIVKRLEESGVGCFVRNCLNNLMWGHYADAEKGICIEFDVSKSLETFISPIPLTYSDAFPKLCYIKETEDFLYKTIGNKETKWSYEEEVRILKLKKGSYPIKKEAIISISFGIKCEELEIVKFVKLLKDNNYLHLKLYKIKHIENSYAKERIDVTNIYNLL